MKAKKQRIAFITGYFPFLQGGAEYQALLLAERLKPQMDIAFVFRDHWRNKGRFTHQGYQMYAVAPKAIKGTSGSFVFELGQVLQILRHYKPDIIYMRAVSAYFMAAVLYAKSNNCRLVWHIALDKEVNRFDWGGFLRHPFRLIDRKMVDYCAVRSDAIVCQTLYQARKLKSCYRRNCDLVVSNWHPISPRPQKEHPTIQIVWIANWKPFKQPEVFVRLACRLKHHTNTRFTMVGRNEGYPDLKAQARESGIRVMGELSKESVARLLAQSHILINTSLMEGFSNTYIEAWMRCVPVVSLYADPDDVLERKKIGHCAKSFGRLVRILERLIMDTELRQRMGETARQHAIQYHSLKNMDRLLPILRGDCPQGK
jgi:glycosyltransferase involved in cell wall biosynthesis